MDTSKQDSCWKTTGFRPSPSLLMLQSLMRWSLRRSLRGVWESSSVPLRFSRHGHHHRVCHCCRSTAVQSCDSVQYCRPLLKHFYHQLGAEPAVIHEAVLINMSSGVSAVLHCVTQAQILILLCYDADFTCRIPTKSCRQRSGVLPLTAQLQRHSCQPCRTSWQSSSEYLWQYIWCC
jgi:hypothetical protein